MTLLRCIKECPDPRGGSPDAMTEIGTIWDEADVIDRDCFVEADAPEPVKPKTKGAR